MELPLFSACLGAMGSLSRKLDAIRDTKLKDGIRKLTTRLLKLSKAQDPPHIARNWMKDVRELSYEMENCVVTEPDWIDKMSGFKARVKAANERYDRYMLETVPSRTDIFPVVDHWFPTDGGRKPDPVVGLHAKGGAVDTLCQWLSDGDKQLKVVSIVGFGGVGKTTLAKQLWREKKLGDFDCRAFVRTAKKPDMRRILRSILVQVRPRQPPNASGVHELIHDINEHLQNKRYFLIIDDLWATSVWDVVSDAFPEGNHYSRIVTTTEIEDVARACCTYPSKDIFKMEPLNFSNSKELFTNGVLGSREEDYRQFDETSDEIARRCAGLPLAIISVASVLASQREADAVENREQTRGRWKGVQDFVYSIIEASIQSYRHINPAQLHNKSASGACVQNFVVNSLPTNTTSDEIMKQVLIFVYNCLSSCLQTCLLHLSLYPENYIVLKEDIMKQWVVEGFICAPTENGKMKVAESYFDKLVSMGLMQDIDVDNSDEVLYYAVHHLVHDFIASKSKEENFVNVIDYSQRTIRLANKVSRLSLQFGSATYATPPASTTTGLSQVRSLVYTGLSSCLPLISEFKLIRFLILHIWDDQPSTGVDLRGISELLLLRYLQVTCNDTVHLPDQVQSFEHLETLEINARVAAIPSDIVHLWSLLHIRLGGGTKLSDVTAISRNVTLNPPAAILLDESSSPPYSVMTIELLPPICRIPKWIGQLTNLCILKVVVRELLTRDDMSNLQRLPDLTVLSLYVQQRPRELISFATGAFAALEYFEFRCGVLHLAFEEGAMPNLQRIKLGFNAHRGKQYGHLLVGIEHLSNVQEIAGIISTAGVEEHDMEAAESAFKDSIGKHHSNVSIQRSDSVEEEHGPLGKQHSVRGKHPSTSSELHGSQKQESQEDIKQNADNSSELINSGSNNKEHASVELWNDPRSSMQKARGTFIECSYSEPVPGWDLGSYPNTSREDYSTAQSLFEFRPRSPRATIGPSSSSGAFLPSSPQGSPGQYKKDTVEKDDPSPIGPAPAATGFYTKSTSMLESLMKIAVARLAIIRQRQLGRRCIERGEVALRLSIGHLDSALARAEQVLEEDIMLEALDIIEHYCKILIEHSAQLEKPKECSEEIKVSAAGLIFTSVRCGWLPELQDACAILANNFGRDFERAATQGSQVLVDPMLVQKLSVEQTSAEQQRRLAKEIAEEHDMWLDFSNNPGEIHHSKQSEQGKNLPASAPAEKSVEQFEVKTEPCEAQRIQRFADDNMNRPSLAHLSAEEMVSRPGKLSISQGSKKTTIPETRAQFQAREDMTRMQTKVQTDP